MATKKTNRAAGRRVNVTNVPAVWRNRIVRTGMATVAEIEMHPDNPKVHGDAQRGAMAAMLDDVGWVAPIILNERTGRLIDGHMRVGLAGKDGTIPAAWVDLDDDEERLIMAAMDPIGAMADTDPDALAKLTAGLETSVDLDTVLAGLLPDDDDEPEKPTTIKLGPLQRAHVLISVPLDEWPEISKVLEQLTAVEGVTYETTVN